MNNNNPIYIFNGKKVGFFGELGKAGKGALLTGLGTGAILGFNRLRKISQEIPEDNVSFPFEISYKTIKRRV